MKRPLFTKPAITPGLCLLSALLMAAPSALGAARDLLVTDFSGDRVRTYDGVTGAFAGNRVNNGVDGPRGLDFTPNGNLLVNVTSGSNRRIAAFDGNTGGSLGNFNTASGQGDMYAAPNGFFYTTGTNTSLTTVNRYNANGAGGAIISRIGDGGAAGTTFGPDGRLYVSIFNGRRIDSYDANGNDRKAFATGLGSNSLSSLAFGPDGHLYVAGGINGNAGNGGRVFKIHGQSGALIDTLGGTGDLFAGPVDLEFGPDGYAYVSASGIEKKIVRVHPTTGVSTNFVTPGSGGLAFPWNIAWEPGTTFAVPAGLTGGSQLRMNVAAVSNPNDGAVAGTDFGTEHGLSAAGDGTAVSKTNTITRQFVVDEDGTGTLDLFFNAALDGQLLSDDGGLASVTATLSVAEAGGASPLGSTSKTFDVQSSVGSPDNLDVDTTFTLEMALQAGMTYELTTELTVLADNSAGGTAEALFANTYAVNIDTEPVPEPAAGVALIALTALARRRRAA